MRCKKVDAGFCYNKRGVRLQYHELADGRIQIRKPHYCGNNPHDPSTLIETVPKRIFFDKYKWEVKGHAPGLGGPSRRELAEGPDGPGADESKMEV